MNKKRDRIQIIYDILKTIADRNGKIRPTHILYKSNLSSQMMNEYLTELLSKGFLIEQMMKRGKTYTLTKKGFDYIEKYRLIVDFIESFGLNEE